MKVIELNQYRQQKGDCRQNAIREAIIENYSINPDYLPRLMTVIDVFVNQVITFENFIKKYQK